MEAAIFVDKLIYHIIHTTLLEYDCTVSLLGFVAGEAVLIADETKKISTRIVSLFQC